MFIAMSYENTRSTKSICSSTKSVYIITRAFAISQEHNSKERFLIHLNIHEIFAIFER